MQPDIMIDIETLGTVPGSLILSIAAVAFDAEAGTMDGEYQAHIEPQSAARLGLKIDASTVAWWMRQSDAARTDAFSGTTNTMSALNGLSQFIALHAPRRIWAKPPSFDLALLEAAYGACSLDCPWHYSAQRDLRTMIDLAGIKPPAHPAHLAIDDARAQAAIAIECFAALRAGRAAPGQVDDAAMSQIEGWS